MSDADELDVFLDKWSESGILKHACLPGYIHDPYTSESLFMVEPEIRDVIRTPYMTGTKSMSGTERKVRGFRFFQKMQPQWAQSYREQLLSDGIPQRKFAAYRRSFKEIWVDGRKRRQNSIEMLRMKASIRNHARHFYGERVDRYVKNSDDINVEPLFSVDETETIYRVNSRLLDVFLSDYLEEFRNIGPQSISELTVRRGAYMPRVGSCLQELNYLSSYSLTIGPVEQFAVVGQGRTTKIGTPSIFSAPLPAIQERVFAFAPFVKGMDLGQLEFVVAPPTERIPLQDDGNHGGIREYSFM